MGRFPMPPPGGVLKLPKVKRCCLPYGESIFIDFSHAGFFWPSANQIFEPELPEDIVFPGGAVGPFKPVKNNVSITLNLFSFEDKKIHRYILKIRTRCPPATKCP